MSEIVLVRQESAPIAEADREAARRVRTDYARMIDAKKATSIAVRVGAERRTFTIQEASA